MHRLICHDPTPKHSKLDLSLPPCVVTRTQTYSVSLTWILDVVLVAVRISSGLGDFIAYTRTTARAFAFDSRYVVLVQVSCVVAPVLCLVIAIPVQRR